MQKKAGVNLRSCEIYFIILRRARVEKKTKIKVNLE